MELLKASLLIFMAVSMSGCSHLSYLVQAGIGQLSLYNRERPIKEVIEDPDVSSETRERLKWIPEIKTYVEAELGAKATSNYTTYVDLKRPYVVWSITIAEKFALKIREWKFPIVGSFPYLGFFKEQMAREWLKEYEDKGYDGYIRGVGAYSTLGYLRDPLLSSMLSRNKSDMVNLIFHESAHGQIYINGQGGFNEQAASYIGDYGERAWIVRNFGEKSAELNTWGEEREDRRRFGTLLKAFSEELKSFYESSNTMPEDERLVKKEEKFSTFRERLAREAKSQTSFLARVAKRITNNAALLALLTYEDDQYVFDLLDQRCKGSVRDALAYMKKFAGEFRSGDRARPQQKLFERLQASVECR